PLPHTSNLSLHDALPILTKEVELLFKESKKLVMHFDQVKNTALNLKESGPLHLSIGLIESAKYWTAQVVKSYKITNPEVFIELEDRKSTRLNSSHVSISY